MVNILSLDPCHIEHKDHIKDIQKIIEDYIIQKISKSSNKILASSISYVMLPGGSFWRSYLLKTLLESLSDESFEIDLIYCAIEMLHTYSLIHDDLPSVDNDNYRRGKLSCHKQYDEATALLTGDALLTLCFEILSSDDLCISANMKIKIIKVLSHHAGYNGMIAGQANDLQITNPNQAELAQIRKEKTGSFFAAIVEIAFILANRPYSMKEINFGYLLGEAFQIKDDICDKDINYYDRDPNTILKELIKTCDKITSNFSLSHKVNILHIWIRYCIGI